MTACVGRPATQYARQDRQRSAEEPHAILVDPPAQVGAFHVALLWLLEGRLQPNVHRAPRRVGAQRCVVRRRDPRGVQRHAPTFGDAGHAIAPLGCGGAASSAGQPSVPATLSISTIGSPAIAMAMIRFRISSSLSVCGITAAPRPVVRIAIVSASKPAPAPRTFLSMSVNGGRASNRVFARARSATAAIHGRGVRRLRGTGTLVRRRSARRRTCASASVGASWHHGASPTGS